MPTSERCYRQFRNALALTLLVFPIAALTVGAAGSGPAGTRRPPVASGAPCPQRLPLLPSGPEGPVAFGAYSTRLEYAPEWDRLWPVSEVADVVVRFDAAEPRFVFWRGTSYVPCWATHRGAWFTNEFFERRGGPASGTTSMVEPMSDKQCRYSNVRILENTDARVVLHWRYAPVDLDYTLAYVDPESRWGDWADEYYFLYPDAAGVRKATLHSSSLHDWIEYQESIVVNQPGAAPEDSLNFDALTIANLKGEQQTYAWTDKGAPTLKPLPPGACLQMVNLKSQWKPFSVVNPEGASFGSYGGHAPGSRFNHWDHWPVSQEKSDTRVASSRAGPSHTSLSQIKWKPFAEDRRSRTWIMMHGMSRLEAGDLIPLAASWLRPPELSVVRGTFTGRGYDPSQRAYLLENRNPDRASGLQFELAASSQSPAVNPAFVVRNWGTSEAGLRLDGNPVEPGSDFRIGHVDTLEGVDLIVWVRTRSERPVRLSLFPR